MSKRKHDEGLDTWVECKTPKLGVKLNSLDSDEEDDVNEKIYDILPEDEIEGQEDSTADFDGNVRITPFNMKEEMEEGHFDTDGNYHWKKEAKLIRDNWLDNIDWVKVKPKQLEEEKITDFEDGSCNSIPFDHVTTYKRILEYMQPGETVAQSLRRLGGKVKSRSASQKWCKGKQKKEESGKNAEESTEEDERQKLLQLTELADELLTETGNMNIYQESFEYITDKVAKANKIISEEPLDMYAEDFDVKEKERLADSVNNTFSSVGSSKFSDKEKLDVVNWEFKWSKDSEDVLGPHSSEQMLEWVQNGHFKKHSGSNEVWVRKCGQGDSFYSSKRVDFELYL